MKILLFLDLSCFKTNLIFFLILHFAACDVDNCASCLTDDFCVSCSGDMQPTLNGQECQGKWMEREQVEQINCSNSFQLWRNRFCYYFKQSWPINEIDSEQFDSELYDHYCSISACSEFITDCATCSSSVTCTSCSNSKYPSSDGSSCQGRCMGSDTNLPTKY